MHIIYVYVKFVLRSKFLQSRSKKKTTKKQQQKNQRKFVKMAIIKHFILWLLTKVHFKIYIDIKMLIKDAQIRLKSGK